ncbi:nicotinamide-nucleotide amidohydrolase family protein, partial [candidate division WOR-3 bacterium]|nr:nicotinamide-nucleotide amidohydrolase family protein [candidate division WOR-3 bacterium]
MYSKQAIIITIGDEILSGRTIDTNTSLISSELLKIGIDIIKHISLPDNISEISKTIKTFLNKRIVLIITGGLGPTGDDKTLKAVSDAVKMGMILDNDLYKKVKKRMKGRDDNIIKKQATIIDGSILLENSYGIAPGVYIKKSKTDIFLMPGVPSEVNYILKEHIVYMLKKGKTNLPFQLRLFGITESEIVTIINAKMGENIANKLAFLPSYGYVDIILYKNKFSKKEMLHYGRKLKKLFKFYIVNSRNRSIEKNIADLLIRKKLTVSCAESCTGGLILKKLTDISGASKYLSGGIIAYSDNSKTNVLSIEKDIIKKNGAVSEIAAREMAANVKNLFKTDIGMSVTGIAGPSGGSKNKKVG